MTHYSSLEGFEEFSVPHTTASVTIQADGIQVTISYDPGKISKKMVLQFQKGIPSILEQLKDDVASLNEELARVITSWNIYEDVEQTIMYPLDADRLAELPLPFRLAALIAILGNTSPEVVASKRHLLN